MEDETGVEPVKADAANQGLEPKAVLKTMLSIYAVLKREDRSCTSVLGYAMSERDARTTSLQGPLSTYFAQAGGCPYPAFPASGPASRPGKCEERDGRLRILRQATTALL